MKSLADFDRGCTEAIDEIEEYCYLHNIAPPNPQTQAIFPFIFFSFILVNNV